jgi:thymidylate synthase
MVPDELIFSGGDCHIYLNQMDGIKEQLIRDPMRYSSPELILTPGITDIDKFTYDDIKIVGYHSYPTIKMPLSVG